MRRQSLFVGQPRGVGGLYYSLSAPSCFDGFRSNVPTGRWPAFRATSRIKQSENPSAGRLRYRSGGATTLLDQAQALSGAHIPLGLTRPLLDDRPLRPP